MLLILLIDAPFSDQGPHIQEFPSGHRRLYDVIFGLRNGVRAIEEKGYNLFEHFLPSIHSAMDAIARVRPIHFSWSNLTLESFALIAEFDIQQIAA
jgi:hypothetical protein